MFRRDRCEFPKGKLLSLSFPPLFLISENRTFIFPKYDEQYPNILRSELTNLDCGTLLSRSPVPHFSDIKGGEASAGGASRGIHRVCERRDSESESFKDECVLRTEGSPFVPFESTYMGIIGWSDGLAESEAEVSEIEVKTEVDEDQIRQSFSLINASSEIVAVLWRNEV